MCNYWHGGTIECRGDGYMWDADDDGWYEDDHSMPCPACNTREYLADARETGEGCSWMSSWSGGLTGEQVWRGAVSVALRANPLNGPRILRQIGIARPIIDHPTDAADFIEIFCDHRNERRLVSRSKREGRYLAERAASIQEGAKNG